MRLCPWSLSIPVLGLERVCPQKGCPWPRNLGFFFCVLGPEPCVLDSTSNGYLVFIDVQYYLVFINVRSNTDHLKLEPRLGLNFVKSQFMLCFAAPEVWYVLPLSVRHSDTVSQFKRRLKSHYFNLAFSDVDDL